MTTADTVGALTQVGRHHKRHTAHKIILLRNLQTFPLLDSKQAGKK